MKRIFVLAACVSFACSGINCYGFSGFEEFYSVFSPVYDKVLLLPDRLRADVQVGQHFEIRLDTRPENLEVVWKSDDENICEIVTGDGAGCILRAMAYGQTQVYAVHQKSDTQVAVTVNVTKLQTQIHLDRQRASMEVGETLVLRARTEPERSGEKIKWETTDSGGYAAISAGGKLCRIRAKKKGKFTVTAHLERGQSAQAEIYISENITVYGYRLCVTLLVTGAILLLCWAWYMKNRMGKNEEK